MLKIGVVAKQWSYTIHNMDICKECDDLPGPGVLIQKGQKFQVKWPAGVKLHGELVDNLPENEVASYLNSKGEKIKTIN
eukprot:scaffold8532_cov65-Attheya_sp.AAC.5